MIQIPNLDRDFSGQTYLDQIALAKLGLYKGAIDNIRGPKTREAFDAYRGTIGPEDGQRRTIRGKGLFDWLTIEVDGEDILIRDAEVTAFGGSGDPQDSGQTASGISTITRPEYMGCALPLPYTGPDAGARKALAGTPLPKIPWQWPVEFIRRTDGKIVQTQLIDLGPNGRTKHAGDLTVSAARKFNPKASATNFTQKLDIRIPGAAKFLA